VKVLTRLGWDAQAAAVQADIMLFAELHGNNQGLVKLLDLRKWHPKQVCIWNSSAPFRQYIGCIGSDKCVRCTR
jgi:hypothetical protein